VLHGQSLEYVSSIRYLGVMLQQNPSSWNDHCGLALKKARAAMFTFRNFYAQYTKKEIVMHVFKAIVRPILEYCAEVIVPTAFYDERFERLQKMAVSLHFRNFDMATEVFKQRLVELNLSDLRSRRCAISLTSFMKMHLGSMHVQPGYFCFRHELRTRTSNRLANNFVVLRNYQDDAYSRPISVYSPSFKKSYFYRVVSNYNSLQCEYDLDSFSFSKLKKFLQLLNYDGGGLVVLT
jgi:hypothetical protein